MLAAITSRSIGRPELARTKVKTAIEAAAKGDFGLSVPDIKRIARKLPRNHTAIIALFENTWERRLKQVAEKHGGAISAQRLISPQTLAAAASQIAAVGSAPGATRGISANTLAQLCENGACKGRVRWHLTRMTF